jgi:uncharacterized protein (TIGR03086 family)
MDLVGVLEQQVERTGKFVAGVSSDQLSASTPCPGFDVRALLNHIVGGHLFMVQAAAGETTSGRDMPDVIGDDPASAYERSAKELLETFRNPDVLTQTFNLGGNEVPGDQALGIAIMEAVVHGWDLATATGQDATIDPGLATGMLQTLRDGGLIESFRNPKGDPFGSEVTVDDSASPGDKLVAYLGRTP